MNRFFLIVFTVICLIPALLFSQETGLIEDFNDNILTGWGETADYSLTEKDGKLKIEANKRNTWNSFTFSFSQLNISANPYVSLKVKTDTDFNLGFSVWDTNDQYAYSRITYQEIVNSNHYTEFVFDFSDVKDVDLTKIKMLNFVFNPAGAIRFQGTVYFDDLKIGSHALVTPSITTIPKQFHIINAPEVTVPFRGVSDPVQGQVPLAVTAVSSNPSLIQDPVVSYTAGDKTGYLNYTPAADQSGLAEITVTVSGNAPDDKIMVFDVKVENNIAPVIDQVETLNGKAGELYDVMLTGINDGNPNAEQSISLTVDSSDPAKIPVPIIQYNNGDPTAMLAFTPVLGQTGPANITVYLKDDGGTINGGVDSSSMMFTVNIYDDVNDPPTIDPVDDVSILEGAEEHIIQLTGISDGDDDAVQNLTVTASSSNKAVVPDPVIEYTQGDSSALLKYTPVSGKTGTVNITVTVNDDGGTGSNNGDQSVTKTFSIQVRVKPTMGFEDDFEDGVLAPEWPPDWGDLGEDSHRCTEENGALKIEIDKTRSGNKWAGLWYNIPRELDLTLYPYISITMKTSVTGTEMLIFLWDVYDHYNTAKTVRHTVTSEYVEYYFDFTGLNLQGDGTIVDFSRIKALLINFDPGGDSPLFQGDFYFDDFRVGEFAHQGPKTYMVTMDPVPDQVVAKNSGAQTIQLTGITDGAEGINPVTITAQSSRKTIIPVPVVSEVVNGKATLTYAPVEDKTGYSTITLTASASGSENLVVRFRINVIDADKATAANVYIDLNREHQTIDGFGAFMGAGNSVINKEHLALAKDIGMSMARFGIIDTEFEPVNDNSDPNIINLNNFNKNAISLETMKLLDKYTGVEKFILTMWSPPAWMKRNKALSAEEYATDNKLEPHYYEEYGEHMAALVKTVKYETGHDLYAISLQNEPQFNEPYASCQVNPTEMRNLIKIVGPRLESEGLHTKIFWAEALPAQGAINSYISSVKNDSVAKRYADIVAIHNYDADGINVGGAGAEEWERIYNWAQNPEPAYPTWMTETSGHANTWDGALELAGNIYNALGYGNASAWVYWSFAVTKDSEVFGLVVDNKPSAKFYVSKQYYKFIRPGAIRIDITSSDEELPCLAFKHNEDRTLTIVMLNKSSDPKAVQVGGSGLPMSFDSYTTAENRSFDQGDRLNRGGVILLPASSITTLIGYYDGPVNVEETEALPTSYGLSQNYPNPFNPTTTIEFQLPGTTNISVKIYDILGREVRVLADQPYSAGIHRINWNGLDNTGLKVATGMYFYRLYSKEFVAVKKCLLIK